MPILWMTRSGNVVKIAAVHRLLFHRNCLLELSSKNGSNKVFPLKFMPIMRRQSFCIWKEQKNEEFIVGIQSAPTPSLHIAAQRIIF